MKLYIINNTKFNKIFRLLYLEAKDAASLTTVILNALKEDKLDVKNLVGIGTDGANVLTGCNRGVYQRLKIHQSELLLVKCVCHSLDLAVDYALKKLPSHLIVMVKRTYDWFCRSSNRRLDYEDVSKNMIILHSIGYWGFYRCLKTCGKVKKRRLKFCGLLKLAGCRCLTAFSGFYNSGRVY